MNQAEFQFDAFSNGQIDSKLWACRELETILMDLPFGPGPSGRARPVVWVLGGWYGVLSLLLLGRGIADLDTIRSFDIDPAATAVADLINNNWVIKQWMFKAFTADANTLDFEHGGPEYGPPPDLVINTSAEHFTSTEWFERIPESTLVMIQTNDMDHEDHVVAHHSIQEHQADFPLGETLFAGEKSFQYPDWGFTRYMSIGYK